jgi:hypothetical protein
MTYTLLEGDDTGEFRQIIRDWGQNPDEFDLREVVTGLERGFAVVTHKRSGAVRSYPIGNGAVFPADFALDLGRGAFYE